MFKYNLIKFNILLLLLFYVVICFSVQAQDVSRLYVTRINERISRLEIVKGTRYVETCVFLHSQGYDQLVYCSKEPYTSIRWFPRDLAFRIDSSSYFYAEGYDLENGLIERYAMFVVPQYRYYLPLTY
jgi:hypothetical protein